MDGTADGHSGRVRQRLLRDRCCSRTGGWVAWVAGHRRCSPDLEAAVTCGSGGPGHRVRPRAGRVAASIVATAWATRWPRWRLASG